MLFLVILVFSYHQFRCFDYDDDGSHDLIGEFTTTMNEMLANPGTNVSR